MRAFLIRTASLLGLPFLFRFFRRHTLTILLYHGVAPKRDVGIYNYRTKFIDPLVFARQMEYLRRKYTILPLEEAIEKLQNGTLPPYTMAVTFDDGYANNYTYAFPVLRAHSVPATIYLTTDFVDKHKPLWVDRLEYLIGMAPSGTDVPKEEKVATDITLRTKLKACSNKTREERLVGLEKSGGVALTDFSGEGGVYAPLSWEECRMMRTWRMTFGAHTMSHPILSRLSIYEQREELAESQRIVREALGSASNIFAYPNGQTGDFTEETKVALEEEGWKGALTTIPGSNTRNTDLYELRRISMDNTENWDIFLLATSGALGWFSSLKRLIT